MRQEHTVELADPEVGVAELGDRYLVTNVIFALPLLAVYLVGKKSSLRAGEGGQTDTAP